MMPRVQGARNYFSASSRQGRTNPDLTGKAIGCFSHSQLTFRCKHTNTSKACFTMYIAHVMLEIKIRKRQIHLMQVKARRRRCGVGNSVQYSNTLHCLDRPRPINNCLVMQLMLRLSSAEVCGCIPVRYSPQSRTFECQTNSLKP